MAKINRLDSNLTNMIAAGEVVERPSGVVKELVENAIDAHAKKIEIYIKQGGIESIQIIDDGDGMSAADSTLAFERHATSKIKDVKDLWHITSLGFRGEALPSIASVSKVYMQTNDKNESSEVEIHFGKLIKAKMSACNAGTNIRVENIFQKMPARFKHLKSPNYEFSLISDVVNKFAICRSDIAFKLVHNDVEIFKTSGNNNLQEVIMAVMDRETASKAIKLEASDNDYKISGYIIQPGISRASKYYMNIFINHRMIRSYKISKAIIDGYKEYLPSDRYPIAFINIEMDATLVDVNVHPSKWEIRLSKEKQLLNLLEYSISDCLKDSFQVNTIKGREEKVIIEAKQFDFTYEAKEEPLIVKEEPIIYEINNPKVESIEPKVKPIEIVEKEKDIEPIKEEVKEDIKIDNIFNELIVIGQLHDAYILASSPNGMYIIDQHAAQERYHYEYIQELIMKGKSNLQPLLMPLTITSTISAVSQIDKINDLLNSLNIHLEVFGNNSFILREVPGWLINVDEEKFIQDLLDLYLKNNKIDELELRKKAIASAACHSSIRFNRTLTLDEMKGVINDLSKCKQPYHCPHGRPTMIEYTLKDLERDFLRVK